MSDVRYGVLVDTPGGKVVAGSWEDRQEAFAWGREHAGRVAVRAVLPLVDASETVKALLAAG